MSPPAASLAGRCIAVTRAGGSDDALTRRLMDLGATVLEAPAIVVAAPESFADLDRALRELATFDWIAFASAHAVERTISRAANIGIGAEEVAARKLATVGVTTARRLEQMVRAPDLVPAVATGTALARAIAGHAGPRRVLVPRAAQGRPELVEGLREAGAEVVAPVAYRTAPAPAAALEPLASALTHGSVDAVLFASPSAVRSVIAALGFSRSLLSGVVLGAIGPTTAAEMRRVGLPVAVEPASASGAAFAEAVAERLGPRPR